MSICDFSAVPQSHMWRQIGFHLGAHIGGHVCIEISEREFDSQTGKDAESVDERANCSFVNFLAVERDYCSTCKVHLVKGKLARRHSSLSLYIFIYFELNKSSRSILFAFQSAVFGIFLIASHPLNNVMFLRFQCWFIGDSHLFLCTSCMCFPC